MGAFKSEKTFYVSQSLISVIAKNIADGFANDDYQVQSQELISGGYDISITKGGTFKAVLGMKTALKVNIYPLAESIKIDAGVGIFGQQAIPTVVSMLFFWPVLITQISGMISQAKLDNRVMEIAEATIAREKSHTSTYTTAPTASRGEKFCTRCGKQSDANAVFCSGCGGKL